MRSAAEAASSDGLETLVACPSTPPASTQGRHLSGPQRAPVAPRGEAATDVFWYAVHTKPKQEERAALNLCSWGIETFAPRLRQARRHPRTRATSYQVSALFPRYIFVRVRPTMVGNVRLTRGVHSVVGFGGFATPVDDGVIELIRTRLDAEGVARSREPRPGEQVRIVEGPLRSLEGLFERELKGQERVLILLHTIGAQARVQVPKASIQQAGAQPGAAEPATSADAS